LARGDVPIPYSPSSLGLRTCSSALTGTAQNRIGKITQKRTMSHVVVFVEGRHWRCLRGGDGRRFAMVEISLVTDPLR
jgi:hypothetical protein